MFLHTPFRYWLEEARTLLAVEIGQDRFDTAGDTELSIDMVEVGLHGIERYTQLIRDVFYCPAQTRHTKNLSLTLGQQCNSGRGPTPSLLQCGNHIRAKPSGIKGEWTCFPR